MEHKHPWIDYSISGIGPAIYHVHKWLLDKHWSHHTHTKLEEKHFLVHVLLEEIHITLHFFSVIATLQKLVTAPPWNHLRTAMWTTGNQVVGQSVTFYLVQQLIHLLLVGIDFVGTSMLTLPVAEIALNASDLLGREGAENCAS